MYVDSFVVLTRKHVPLSIKMKYESDRRKHGSFLLSANVLFFNVRSVVSRSR